MAKSVKQRKYEYEERDENGLIYKRILLSKPLADILEKIAADLNLDKLNIRGFKIDKGDKTKTMALLLGSVVSNHFGDLEDWFERGAKGLIGIQVYQGRLSVVNYQGEWNLQPIKMEIDLEHLKRELEDTRRPLNGQITPN